MRREVRLKTAFAILYPSLHPGRWYSATAIASLVKDRASRTGACSDTARLLVQDHFEFRGGYARSSGSSLRTRYVDRHADLSVF